MHKESHVNVGGVTIGTPKGTSVSKVANFLKTPGSFFHPENYPDVFGVHPNLSSNLVPLSQEELHMLVRNNQTLFWMDPDVSLEAIKNVLSHKFSGIHLPSSCSALKELIFTKINSELSSLNEGYWCVSDKGVNFTFTSEKDQKKQAKQIGATLPTISERLFFLTLMVNENGFGPVRSDKFVRCDSQIVHTINGESSRFNISIGMHNSYITIFPSKKTEFSPILGTSFVRRPLLAITLDSRR